MLEFRQGLVFCFLVALWTVVLFAQDVDTSRSEMRPTIERYTADRGSLNRSSPIDYSPANNAQMKQFYSERLSRLSAVNFDAMGQDGRVDYLLSKNHNSYHVRQRDIETKNLKETAGVLPVGQTIIDLEEPRRRMETMDCARDGATLSQLERQIDQTRKSVEADGARNVKKFLANRAARTAEELRNSLKNWFGFYNGYDPLFTWWGDAPYQTADRALHNYVTFLHANIVHF